MNTDSNALDLLADFDELPLPFAWQDLARRTCASGGYPAISVDAGWTTVLEDGREVFLTALHQYRTYEGVLCGFPETDEVRAWPIEGAVRMADQLFHCEPSKVVILPPELVRSTVVTMREGKREEVAVDFLPAVCSVATFESKEPVTEGADASEVVAVWFQGSFGLPEPGHVTRSIQAIDWDEFAGDYFSIEG